MTEHGSGDDNASFEQGLEMLMAAFADARQAWELEEIMRDLIPPDVMATPHSDAFVDAIISGLERHADGVSALHIIGAVGMPLPALRARSAVGRIVEGGGPQPSALARRCGTLIPEQAWRLEASDGRDAFVFVLRRSGARRVQTVLIATTDAGDGPILIEGDISSPVAQPEFDDLMGELEADGLQAREVSLSEAGTELLRLAERNIASGHGPTEATFPALVAVLPHVEVPDWEGLVTALAQLPLAEFTPNEDQMDSNDEDFDEPQLPSDDEMEAIDRDLTALRSAFDRWHNEREDDPDRRELATFLADSMFGYRAWYRNGAPWDEGMLTEFLLGHAPRKLNLEPDDVVATPLVVPDVLEFLAERGDIPAGSLDRLTGTVESLAPAFFDAMNDPERHGLAKRMGQLIAEDGVDITDQAALQQWMDDFNALPQERRKELLPDSAFRLPPAVPSPPPAGQWGDRGGNRRKRTAARDARKKNRRRK